MKRFKLALPTLAVLLIMFFFQQSDAQIYVKWDAPGGDDGSSWTNAYTDLQSALATAVSGDQIWVAAGTYKPTSGSDRTISFDIPSGVEVYGGFDGTESLLEQRDWENNLTMLSGNIGDVTLITDNSYTIVKCFQVNSSTVLDGLSIEDGYANGFDTTTRSGAAVFINGASAGMASNPQIKNCTMMDNTASSGGGAVYVDGSASGSTMPVFENCKFLNNASSADGGAFYNSGITSGTCIPEFKKCTFKDNTSIGSGGAVFNHGGNGNSSPIFKNCDFDSNTAEGNGGAMYNLGSNGNSSPEYHNCRFYNNHGFSAGGIYNLGSSGGNSSPDIINCTFVANEATGAGGTGGAIYNNADAGGTSSPEVTNCVIWGNIAPYGSDVFRNIFGTPTISYSIVDVADCASLNSGEGSNVTCGAEMVFNDDPLFINEAGGDFRLGSGSPAANEGANDVVTETEDLDCDQRIQQTTVDIGAYESAFGPLPVELVDFRAYFEEGFVVLNWITLSEENNNYFTVERSSDGFQFEKIATIDGHGTTTTAHSYKTLDRNPFAGLNYYRLRQTDFDGKSSLSEIEVVNVAKGRIIAYPNPVIDNLHLSFSEFNESEAEFAIYNVYGKLVYRGVVEVNHNLSTIHLSEVGDFVPGTYVIQVLSPDNGQISHKFQKIGD